MGPCGRHRDVCEAELVAVPRALFPGDAGGLTSLHVSARASPSARLRRRKEVLVRRGCGDAPSGEKTAPEGRFPTEFRTRCALRRRILAGAGTSDGIPSLECALRRGNGAGRKVPDGVPYETRPPARKRRRNRGSRRDYGREAPSGVGFSPEARFRACSLRQLALRRRSHFDRQTPTLPPTPPQRKLLICRASHAMLWPAAHLHSPHGGDHVEREEHGW